MGTKGYVKEGLELTPMGSFNIGQVLSGRTLHGDVQRTGVDGRDLASTYVLRPLTIALFQISE